MGPKRYNNSCSQFSPDGLPWEAYTQRQRAGKLCYFCASADSLLPIRNILGDRFSGRKWEPNYETATYNAFKSCNQTSVRRATAQGYSHLLFVTRYAGTLAPYRERYFIVGFLEIGWTAPQDGRVAVKASQMAFVEVAHAYEITPERWRRICPNANLPRLTNLRYAIQTLSGPLFEEIVQNLAQHNALERFVLEANRLKSRH